MGATQRFADWVGSTDTDDYYQFTLADTSSISLLLSGVSAATRLYLERANGQLIASSSATSNLDGSLVYDLAAGTYFVDVLQYGGDTGYNVSMSATHLANFAGTSAATAPSLGNLNG
ncbi:PPC domain-containing protein, partial [Methanobacterium formicicum]|uniref:PPC domain-containing protein n=1 Tax=Methanobacterium formicicum TaxID=2162 RepID=UPI0024124148